MKRGAKIYRKWFQGLLILFCLLLLTASCNFKKEAHKIKIVNEVKVIDNFQPEWGDEPKIELEFVRKLGGLDTKDENYIFHRPFDLVQDKDGNKYVLTVDDYCVRKFDSDWKYLMRFGKKGQGPGEVLRSYGSAIDKQSNIYVIDHGNMRVQIFSPEGEPKGNIRMNHQSLSGAVLSSGKIVLTARSFHSPGPGVINRENPTMLAIADTNGELIDRFVKCKEFSEPDLMYDANRVNFDIDENDNIYVVFEHQNRIEKYSPNGGPIFFANRPLKFEIKHKVVNEKGYSMPILTFVSVDIGVDHKGRLWVTTFDVQPESQGSRGATLKDHRLLKFEVYDNNGILLGELPVPTEFYKKRIYGNILYLIDPYFEASIYEFRIIEK